MQKVELTKLRYKFLLCGNTTQAFTLVELLIVIVIIGILSGVVIAVIDPVQQQNRAKDAGVQASMNKIALVAQSNISAYGRAPTEAELVAALDNVTILNGTDCSQTSFGVGQVCRFEVEGTELPATCTTNYWTRQGTTQCYILYYRLGTWPQNRFRVFAKAWGLNNRNFVMDNTTPGVYHCSDMWINATRDITDPTNCERWND